MAATVITETTIKSIMIKECSWVWVTLEFYKFSTKIDTQILYGVDIFFASILWSQCEKF